MNDALLRGSLEEAPIATVPRTRGERFMDLRELSKTDGQGA